MGTTRRVTAEGKAVPRVEDAARPARARTRRSFWFVESEGGFTSIGVVIALTLVLALLFTTAQVYWVESTAADIQFVADAGALAAENVVAEYMTLAQLADAVVLSLSLFGLVVYGIAIVVSCIPYMQEVGVQLMDFGSNVFKARDNVADTAASALNGLQKLLPFLCAVNAASTISANVISYEGKERYYGIAIVVPLEGEDVGFADDSGTQGAGEEIDGYNQHTAEQATEASEAYERMQTAKDEAYRADCGNAPNYCMYERAGRLAGLAGIENPHFASVDLWRFDYAFDRAKAYYRKRLAAEAPLNTSLDEQVRSFARTRYYTYAVAQMAAGYAHTSSDGTLSAYFPLLARNNDEVRQTVLYAEQVYPVSADGHLHGSTACPDYTSNPAGTGSIQQLELGTYEACARCGISINTIGRVASASTSIDNGFEYHYRIVADAANRYREAAAAYKEHTDEAKDLANQALDVFAEALAALDTPRLFPKPPGRSGCIAIVIDTSAHEVPGALSRSFVAGEARLQPRIAISAATLAQDKAEMGHNLLASFLDRVDERTYSWTVQGSALGFFDSVLTVWGDVLLVYSEGADSLSKGLGDFLRSIPLVGSTPLAAWAESALQETIEAVGLQGADLSLRKPVLVNSMHVLAASDSGAANVLGGAKEAYSSVPGSGSGTLAQSAVDGLIQEAEVRGGSFLDDEFTLFTLSFGDLPGLPQIPIRVRLPAQVSDRGKGLLAQMRASLEGLLGGGGGDAVWE